MKKYLLLLFVLLFTSSNPSITKNLDNVDPTNIENIEKLENKKHNFKISKFKYTETTLATITKVTEKITKTSLVMIMEATLSHLKANLTTGSIFLLVKFITNASSPPNAAVTSIESIICGILILNIYKQASRQASNIQNISYDFINKKVSTQKVLVKFSSFIGFLSGTLCPLWIWIRLIGKS